MTPLVFAQWFVQAHPWWSLAIVGFVAWAFADGLERDLEERRWRTPQPLLPLGWWWPLVGGLLAGLATTVLIAL